MGREASWLGALCSWLVASYRYLVPSFAHSFGLALAQTDTPALRQLLAGSPCPDDGEVLNQGNERGETALWLACSSWDLDLVRLLLANPRVNLNRPDHRGRTPLAVACEVGCEAIAEELLKCRRAEELVLLGAAAPPQPFRSSSRIRDLLQARLRWPRPLHPLPLPSCSPSALERQGRLFLEVFLGQHWGQVEITFEFLPCLPPDQSARLLAHLREGLLQHRTVVRSTLVRPFLSRAWNAAGRECRAGEMVLFESETLLGFADPKPAAIWFDGREFCFGGACRTPTPVPRLFSPASPCSAHLCELDLSHSRLERMPAISLPATLRSLSLAHNRLTVILPTVFGHCHGLEAVVLEGNPDLVYPPPHLHPHEVVPFAQSELAECGPRSIREIAERGPSTCCFECGQPDRLYSGVVALGYFVCYSCYNPHRSSTWTDARIIDRDGWSRYHEVLFGAVGNHRAQSIPPHAKHGARTAAGVNHVTELLHAAYHQIGCSLLLHMPGQEAEEDKA